MKLKFEKKKQLNCIEYYTHLYKDDDEWIRLVEYLGKDEKEANKKFEDIVREYTSKPNLFKSIVIKEVEV